MLTGNDSNSYSSTSTLRQAITYKAEVGLAGVWSLLRDKAEPFCANLLAFFVFILHFPLRLLNILLILYNSIAGNIVPQIIMLNFSSYSNK